MRFTPRLAAAIQKSWREASTLLIASEVTGGSKILPGQSSTNSNNTKPCLEYLMLERSAGSRFMPGGLCFPGGTISVPDSSKHWNDLFHSAGIDLLNFKFMEDGANKPSLYNPDYKEEGECLSREVSFRITAIRETFEECGVLLCKPFKNSTSAPKLLDAFFKDPQEVAKWQKTVSSKPEDFICLCDSLHCVPDLQALVEWSNWLTPVSYKSKNQRFDTMFYMVLLPPTTPRPRVFPDGQEMANFIWDTPLNLLKGHADGTHLLLPPQAYEILRLMNVGSSEQMLQLLKLRKELGIERWCPYLFISKDDCGVSLFPGDDMYPANLDIHLHRPIEKSEFTTEELGKKSTNKHRSIIPKPKEGMPYLDITSTSRFGQSYSPQ